MDVFLYGVSLCGILLGYGLLWARISWDGERGRRVPLPKASWAVLSLVDAGLFITAEGPFKYQALACLFGSGSILAYAVFNSEPGWTRADKIALALALPALLAWALFSPSTLAVCLLIGATSIGAAEICIELWRNPRVYGLIAWWCFWLGGGANLVLELLEPKVSAERLIAPLGFFIIQSVMLALALRRRRARSATAVDLSPILDLLAEPEEAHSETRPFRRAT